MNLKVGRGVRGSLEGRNVSRDMNQGFLLMLKIKNSNLNLYIYFPQIFINDTLVHYSLHTPSTILFYAFKYFTNINYIVQFFCYITVRKFIFVLFLISLTQEFLK